MQGLFGLVVMGFSGGFRCWIRVSYDARMSGTSCGAAGMSGTEGRLPASWKIRGLKNNIPECLWQCNNSF